MKRFFTNEDFEDFLKTNSDRYQMRPSDKVWKAIADDLGKKRRRAGWITGLFLLFISSIAYYFSFDAEQVAKQQPAQNNPSPATTTAKNTRQANSISPATLTEVQLQHSLSLGADDNRSNSKPVKRAGLYVAYKKSHHVEKPAIADAVVANNSADASSSFEPIIADSYPSDNETTVAEPAKPELNGLPLSIESVTNIFNNARKSGKLSLEFFVTPTVSYRNLTENKKYMDAMPPGSTSPNYAALYNINDAVTHKPSIGMELGMAAKYPVAENIRIKGGLQFNMSRYDIKAFRYYAAEAATVAFIDGNRRTSASNYSNVSGNTPDWLQNVYFQVAVPVGIEVKLGQKDRTQFGVSSSIQPTYMIGERAYLLSTDYKNYIEVPYLVRRWNVNTAIETFVSYSTKKINWQVGPQVRYQLLSSFISNYPVKEHLFDFGLKIGVSLKGNTTGSKE